MCTVCLEVLVACKLLPLLKKMHSAERKRGERGRKERKERRERKREEGYLEILAAGLLVTVSG